MDTGNPCGKSLEKADHNSFDMRYDKLICSYKYCTLQKSKDAYKLQIAHITQLMGFQNILTTQTIIDAEKEASILFTLIFGDGCV